ncbi:MAG: cytochrome c-type biogenesis protein CcmH [Bdellovibrionota bacterium]
MFPRFGYGQTELDLQATEMEKHLIAPCCWSKTLDQEQSEVAIYMKQKIKQQLALGKSVDEIYGMFEEEFGERVLAQPKNQVSTGWFGFFH